MCFGQNQWSLDRTLAKQLYARDTRFLHISEQHRGVKLACGRCLEWDHKTCSHKFDVCQCMRACKTWAHDHRLAQVEHAPNGLMLHQPSLLRGSGLLEPKTCLYDKQFRRFTLERIQAGITAGKEFMVEGGVRGAFVSTWVMPKHDFAGVNQSSMELYLNLMFATDVACVHELFPKTSDDALDLGKLRQLHS